MGSGVHSASKVCAAGRGPAAVGSAEECSGWMCDVIKAYTGLAPQENVRAGHAVSELSSECWLRASSHRCSCAYGEEEGREMVPSDLVFPEKSPSDPCLSNPCSEIGKQVFLPYNPHVFKLLLPCYVSMGLFAVVSL